MEGKKTILIILDGWGHGDKTKSDAVYNANTPFIDSLYSKYPNCNLLTDGENVGLPKNQMGNSEVGHLNIGAGRVVNQDLAKINLACLDNSISKQKKLNESFSYVKKYDKALHLIGLVSDGGIHSHQNHLYKICELANKAGVKKVYIHAFTDGRDCDSKSGVDLIKKLQNNLFGAKIASICGRYFAMDRDNRWDRIKKAYDLMVHAVGEKSHNASKSLSQSYEKGITDEFINPIVLVDKKNKPIAKIENQDAVICFNFRTDRCRQITYALSQENVSEFDMHNLNLHYTTLTNYDKSFNVNVIYERENIKNTLGEILEKNNKSQIRIAETEKYPHVTYFFSGGRESFFNKEKRLMIESPKVATYDLQPEMSAFEVTERTVAELEKNSVDFICLNYANPDMVGHTGNYKAIKKSVEMVDQCTEKVVNSALKNDYAVLIVSDHGNAEFTINNDGSPNTAHTVNPVPCIVLNTGYSKIKNGILADIAPTILKIMNIQIPEEMTGKILIS